MPGQDWLPAKFRAEKTLALEDVYRIVGEIATGGGGSVHHVVHESRGKHFAVKRIQKDRYRGKAPAARKRYQSTVVTVSNFCQHLSAVPI